MSALDNGMRLHNHDFYKYFNLNGFYIDSVLFKHQLWCCRSSASCSQVNCLTNQRLQLVQLGLNTEVAASEIIITLSPVMLLRVHRRSAAFC